jgi:serine/threonine protein kinase
MDPLLARPTPASTPSFQDGLGERFLLVDRNGIDALEMLVLRGELVAVPSFEFALRERLGRLANFRHAYYSRVRRIDRIGEQGGLAVVSEHTSGARLSDILTLAEREHLPLDINAALCLIRQLVPAVAMLHQNARDVAHGALGPERIVVTPHARLVIVEHVLGSALEQLHYSHERLWKEFRISIPPSAGLPRFDHRADVTQIGMTALALILGRNLTADEFPKRVGDIIQSASARSSLGGREPLVPGLKTWLSRALQLDYRSSFHSAVEAQNALEETLAGEGDYIAAPVALETFLARYEDRARAPYEVAPVLPPKMVEPVREEKPTPPEPSVPSTPVASKPLEPPKIEFPEIPPALEEFPPEPVGAAHAPAEGSSERELFSVDPERLFAPEPKPQPKRVTRPVNTRRYRRMAIAVMAVLLLVEAAYLGATRFMKSPEAPPARGVLVVESQPAGAEVVIDGRVRGVTPLNLSLPPGPHSMELRAAGGQAKLVPITIQRDTQQSHYVQLDTAAAVGHLVIRSEPAGARVVVDGVARGVTPATVGNLTPGQHEVVLESDLGRVTETVQIAGGATATLVVPLVATGAPVSGWISVSAPFEMQLFENGRLIGTSQSERIMVAAGGHEIEVVNEALGFRATRTVQVPPGRVAPLRVELPRGSVSLNAVPWAEVWIDGERLGETPMANVAVPIGPHEVVFRNPQFGERRHVVTVTTGAPARVSVDLRK